MSHAATTATLDGRLTAVRERLVEAGLDAVLVTSLANVAYLSGLRASAAALIVTRGDATLITDFRYREAARQQLDRDGAPSGLRLQIVETSYDRTLVDVLRRLGVRTVGVEAEHLTVKRFHWFQRALEGGPSVEPIEQLVEQLRMVKDEAEIEIMRQAARRLSDVVPEAWKFVSVGRTEREVAADIDSALVRAGFERPAFETIVASGSNSALPHARPTARRIGPGDPLLLDFGGVYDGYCVDLTRAGVVGPAGPALRSLHEAVAAAQAAALAAAGPGVLASSIDRVARETLKARGFGKDVFGHGTGHGIGLEVHEAPRIAPVDSGAETDTPLAAGMIFTVEPGAYVPEVGGVRLEDDVLVTCTGVEVLTSARRELREL